MSNDLNFKMTAVATTKEPRAIFHEVCEHFVEHAEVQQGDNRALMISELGRTEIWLEDSQLLIDIRSDNHDLLLANRTMLAEHLFYFAGENPFDLQWSEPETRGQISNLHEVEVVRTEVVTPNMRRVILKCGDVAPFVGGNMHVRILVPPKGRVPVWPGLREDGRVSWPKGVDALTVRIYTIRFVNLETQELWLDFVQHPAKQLPTPGADFARDAVPGDRLAIVGPGGGHLPQHDFLLLAGDESALPAIARIAAEVPEGTRIEAIIEVANHREVQSLPSKASMNVTWIYRDDIAQSVAESLSKITVRKLTEMSEKPYVWFAAERSEVKFVKEYLKASQHDKKQKYTAWYWERDKAQAGD